jgi:hypothetical protein
VPDALPPLLPDDPKPSLLHRVVRRWWVILGALVALIIGIVIGATGKTPTTAAADAKAAPAPTVTVTQHATAKAAPAPTVTVTQHATANAAPAPTVTETVTASPSSNSGGGSATSPSSSGSQTVTFIVYGDGSAVNVTYGPAGSNDTGTEPMNVTDTIPSSPPSYYAISAQLQGGGSVSVIIKVDGQQISSGVAKLTAAVRGELDKGWDRNTEERGREVALSLVRGLLSPRVTVSRDAQEVVVTHPQIVSWGCVISPAVCNNR